MSADTMSSTGIQQVLLATMGDLRQDLGDLRDDVQGLRTELGVHLALHQAAEKADEQRDKQRQARTTERREGLRSRLMVFGAFGWLFGAATNFAFAHFWAAH